MSNEHNDGETTVFASAKPVSPADLVDGETETGGETTTPKSETKTKTETKTTGVPPWHLSAALGLTLALIGGVVLWLQSPLLAVVVIGGLVALVGLGLALRHFFRSETAQQRRATRSQGGDGTGGNRRGGGMPQSRETGGRSQSRSRETKGDQKSEAGPTKRRPWSRSRETSDRDSETGGRTRSRRRSRDRSQGQPPVSPQAPGGPRGNGGRPRGSRTPQGGRTQAHVNPGPQSPGSRPLGTRTPQGARPMIPGSTGPRVPENSPPRPLTGRPVSETPKPIDPPKTKNENKKGDDKSTSVPDVPKVAPPQKPRLEEKVKTSDIAWPNVDLDHYTPVKAHNMPRITIPRKAVRLPPIYHRDRMGEPSWPTKDPDATTPPIPDQRNRRSGMTTVDMLPKAARDARLATAAATANGLAQDKATKAHEFLALAQQLDGVEGMEERREEHLVDAQRAAHDADVREAMVKIYDLLRRK